MTALPRLACALLLIAIAVAGAVRPAAAVRVERVVADGVEAWLIEEHASPTIAVSLAFRGGAALDPPGREGQAAMTMALLDEGAGDLDARAFQGRLADLAVSLGFRAGPDAVTGSLRTLTANRDAAFAMLRMAITQPRFDADAVERVRGQMQARLRSAAEDPEWVATRRFYEAMFPGAAYGRPVEGTHESLAALSADDARAFVRDRFAREALVVAVCGDITAAELRPLLAATFAGLPATASIRPIADVIPAADGGTIVVEMPARQSAVVFGQRGLRRNDPDFYPLAVVNQILGGSGLNSVLFEAVREKRGLAYSIYTNLVPLDHSALWIGRAGTSNERVAETVAVVRSEWRRMAETGVDEAQVADAKTYLTGSFPLRFTSNPAVANLLLTMQLDRLGIDWIEERNRLIEAVTVGDANRVARTVLNADQLTVVIAGQPQGVPVSGMPASGR